MQPRTRTKHTRKRSRISPAAAAEALQRITDSLHHTENFQATIDGFAARGIADVRPKEDVLTYAAWQARGRQVRRGERGVRVSVWIERDNRDTGERERFRRNVALFHESQTCEIGAAPPPIEPDPQDNRRGPDIAAMLRDKAAALQKKIDYYMNPPTADQNPTRRRLRILDSMRHDGARLERVQRGLLGLADLHDAGAVPPSLADVRSVRRAEELLNETTEAGEAFRGLADGRPSHRDDGAAVIRRMEIELLLADIPGFFPTPAALAERMVELAEIAPGHRVLEPSAGSGAIADAIRAAGHEPECMEINHQLAELLRLKGHTLSPTAADCTEAHRERWDRIVMNPPFERGQDIEHVSALYHCLRPGGRLVAIMSAGAFFRGDRKASEFREWLEGVGGFFDALPDGSFKPQTSVNAYMVVIDRQR